jgi:perosamine synthetase
MNKDQLGKENRVTERIPVASPSLIGNEREYVLDCIDTTWISSAGKYVSQFESAFADFCQVEHAISCCNGTAALHLALLAMDVGPGDEVIVPTLTFVATANAVSYCGARPVFVDSEPETWNMDPAQIEARITPRTRGIIAVHLYGHPVDMDPLLDIARRHGLFFVEDAAEAHGAEYKGRRVGRLGDLATFSFYGNKIIATGEGGMVVTDDAALARKMLQLKGQGQDFERRYWFPVLGYNYRMTNIQAALGLAQLEKVDWHLARRREIAGWYQELLGGHPLLALQPEKPWARNVYWMNSVVLAQGFPLDRDETMRRLAEEGIETRPFFYPMHTLPIYRSLAGGGAFPVAESVAARGMNLPSSAGLTYEDVAHVAERLIALGRSREQGF